jgi:MoaA/NifB/PqqE/SkfB family radical SAM enzyme
MRLGPKIRWDVTLVCNLNCRHCQIGDAKFDAVHPSRDHLISVGMNLINGGVSQVGLLGGEPLLHPSILDLLSIFAEHGIHITISTNGLRLPTGLMPILAESSGWSIMVSLDGPDAETHERIRGPGTFEQTITNIKHLVLAARSHQFNVGIACTLTSLTVQRMKAFYDLANSLGVNILQFGVVKPVGNAKTNYYELGVKPESLIAGLIQFTYLISGRSESDTLQVMFDFINKPTADILRRQTNRFLHQPSTDCVGADSTAFVDSAGCMWPCPAIRDGFQSGSLRYPGSANNSLVVNDFETVWYGELFQHIRQLKNKKAHLTRGNPCKKCVHARTCTPCPLPYWCSGQGQYDLCEYTLGLATNY